MQPTANGQRASALSLLPMAFVAAAIVVVALLASGGRAGTIVVQRIVETYPLPRNKTQRFVFTAVSETSADGAFERLLAGNSSAGAADLVTSGQLQERYLPRDNTVYEITQMSFAAAYARFTLMHFHRRVAVRTPALSYAGSWLAPGRESFFERQFHAGNYELAGQVTVDGRKTLKLVPTPGRESIPFAQHSRAQTILMPAYVSPGSFDPVEERENGATIRWTQYRVVRATPANQRLVSITAVHPGTRVSHSAMAYVRELFGPAAGR